MQTQKFIGGGHGKYNLHWNTVRLAYEGTE